MEARTAIEELNRRAAGTSGAAGAVAGARDPGPRDGDRLGHGVGAALGPVPDSLRARKSC